MNDRHPSEGSTPTVPAPDASYSPHYGAYGEQQPTEHAGYDGYATGGFDQLGSAYGDGDPTYGTASTAYPDYGTGHSGYDATSCHASGHEDSPIQQVAAATPYGAEAYDATAMWDTSGQPVITIPAQQSTDVPGAWDAQGWDTSGSWDGSGWDQTNGTGVYDVAADTTTGSGQFNAGPWNGYDGYDASGQHDVSGQYDAPSYDAPGPHGGTGQYEADEQWDGSATYHGSGANTGMTQVWDATTWSSEDSGASLPDQSFDAEAEPDGEDFYPPGQDTAHEASDLDAGQGEAFDDEPVAVAAAPRSADRPTPRRDSGRSRRRTAPSRPKRSALLTVAVPSVAIMGVTAVAAAAVSGIGQDGGTKDGSTPQAAPDTSGVKASVANSKLDTQLASLTADADDFADRASRTQERIDLKARQEAEKKRKAEEAARKEALRPKFALPVAQHGLSAGYGQAGINWMSVHTGIDFPVGYGTPVMAATDGTVRTQWNSAYGNMAIVTSPDGTETWYCHLSSTKIRSGTVKAGDVIAYSGNSGNSTGPHLHFEVRPGGGSAVDPTAWLRSHGLDPT